MVAAASTLAVARSEIGVPRVYSDYRELLAREHPDIVPRCLELALTAEIGEVRRAAARRADRS